MDRLEHGRKRAGKIGASVARTIMHGGMKSWESLIQHLWTDEGEGFLRPASRACAYGHEHEAEGAAKFWERHDEYELREVDWMPCKGRGMFDAYCGCSPDRLLVSASGAHEAGLEIKSPTTDELCAVHTPAYHEDQLQHSMWATGISKWWLVVHHGTIYREHLMLPDLRWQMDYEKRLRAFIAMLDKGTVGTVRKLSIADLGMLDKPDNTL